MTFDEKIEIIYDSYERTLDYEIGCLRADLSDKEREKADNHEGLQLRIKLYDADQREEWIQNLRDIAKNGKHQVSLQATKELGKMLYKERFGDEETEDKTPTNVVVNLRGKYPDKDN